MTDRAATSLDAYSTTHRLWLASQNCTVDGDVSWRRFASTTHRWDRQPDTTGVLRDVGHSLDPHPPCHLGDTCNDEVLLMIGSDGPIDKCPVTIVYSRSDPRHISLEYIARTNRYSQHNGKTASQFVSTLEFKDKDVEGDNEKATAAREIEYLVEAIRTTQDRIKLGNFIGIFSWSAEAARTCLMSSRQWKIICFTID